MYLINTKTLLPQMLIRLSVDSRNDAMRQFYFTKTYRAEQTPDSGAKARDSSLDSRFGSITLSPIRKERHEIQTSSPKSAQFKPIMHESSKKAYSNLGSERRNSCQERYQSLAHPLNV